MDCPIQEWGNEINWEKRVKSVCKPCWEIKYCPYGPLIENFPLKENNDEKSCRIFGHDCPVFCVAEPFTETKELRNISRSIPRKTQFRVLKRENQICSNCGNAVKDEDIEFDHIIPWSKGGSSDEHNVKLLCKKCNRKKGNKFEENFLINSPREHFKKPVPFKFINVIFCVIKFVHENFNFINNEITPEDHCKIFNRRKIKEEDKLGTVILNDIKSFFTSPKPQELQLKEFNALKYRWGFIDGKFHKLSSVSEKYKIDINNIFELDHSFIERVGFYVNITEATKKSWLKK